MSNRFINITDKKIDHLSPARNKLDVNSSQIFVRTLSIFFMNFI